MNDTKRIEQHMNRTSFANKHKNDICAFNDLGFKVERKIGTRSKFGEVFVVSADVDDGKTTAAMKLMPKNPKNTNEVRLYRLFNGYVENYKNPHFPLVFYDRLCNQCPYQQQPRAECYVVLNELADGDFKMWLRRRRETPEFMSFWSQMAIACMGLEQEGLIHGDLHWGNLLYHKVHPDNIGKYTHYVLKGNDVYVKNTGQHWVLWDFGKTKNAIPGRCTSVNVDMRRISHSLKWTKNQYNWSVPKKVSSMYRHIQDRLRRTHSYMNFLKTLQSIYAQLEEKDILLINPATPPEPSNIINNVTYTM